MRFTRYNESGNRYTQEGNRTHKSRSARCEAKDIECKAHRRVGEISSPPTRSSKLWRLCLFTYESLRVFYF